MSDHPFVLKIKTRGISTEGLGLGISKQQRSSGRTPKRKRPTYQALQDTDSDGLVDSDEDIPAPVSKKLRKSASARLSSAETRSSVAIAASSGTRKVAKSKYDEDEDIYALDQPIMVDVGSAYDPKAIDAPPQGVLNALWYSREIFLHSFVVDKIVGYTKRRATSLLFDDESTAKIIDPKEASELSQKVLSNTKFWIDACKRNQVSRINPTQCPIVLRLLASKEEKSRLINKQQPRFKIDQSNCKDREEVLLVKWRGRSHLHCSWERPTDIQRLDPSNNTARNKIRRYYQSQEVSLGIDWKKKLEEARKTAGKNHNHGDDVVDDEVEIESFSPQCLEIGRVMTCDENEMDLNVLAKQRALNKKLEQEQQNTKVDEALAEKNNDELSLMVKDIIENDKNEEPWDPEDNVRYVVKWKGLPYAEITWEYWRDIKRDAVDEAEDFWCRQKPPSAQDVKKQLSISHPHMKEFRKLQKSAIYGNSKRKRPVPVLEDGSIQEEEEPEPCAGFQLRSYQLEGVNWLLFNWWNKRSCILADEMGLGKTIQTLCFLQELQAIQAAQVRGPFLVVAPLSLIGQWQSEAKSWAPDLNVVLYHGSADARDFLVKNEFYYSKQFIPKQNAVKLKKQHITKLHILITTYEVVLKDISVISKVRWKVLVVDEAHRLKNSKTRFFQELATVPRDHCLLLTGTPLANATEELWALLHFNDPIAFAEKDDFLEKFGQLTDVKQVNELHNVLKPYLLRRLKEDVEKSLPPKEETILEVSLTPTQKNYYKAIYEKNTAFLFKGSKPSNAPSLMNIMMELRKCCNHPFLVKGAEERILNDAAAAETLKNEKVENGSKHEIDYFKLFGDQLVKSSGKMVLMEKLLHKLKTNGHKVLIFSQMVRVLDLLEELLKIKRYGYERLDGSTSSSARATAVERFNRKSCRRFVMLLSTRAGGLGLNLTAADTVIIFDSDWNPQNDLQAMARAHRIGQTRAVQVYRLLTAKTYEMHMFHSASLKLGLERAVLSQQREQNDDKDDSKQKRKSDREAQAKEIDELLKKGAYGVFRDEDDAEAKKFMETDIDQLLERSSKKVTYGASSSKSSGLGSFSKASFVASTGDGEKDVDLDDPDFWSKAIGLDAPVEISEEMQAMLDDGVKRSRKQVQVFDPYAEFAEAEQRKKDKVALKVKEEKEEKSRRRLERKQKKKKKDKKKKKNRQRDEHGRRIYDKTNPSSRDEDKKSAKETKSKKPKKTDRMRALKRAENEDPILERLKQAWEVPQRNRTIAAVLRFGFGRFCKIRNESNLTSLPLQDLEVFVRSYAYQLSLQLSVSIMRNIQSESNSHIKDIKPLLVHWLGTDCKEEVNWICSSMHSVMSIHIQIEKQRRLLRMPMILAEPSFVSDLRRGAAFRSLRRIGLLSRINTICEDAIESILSVLGHEELAKRGCGTSGISSLDADLRARHVSYEELSLVIGFKLGKVMGVRSPAAWWDRSCDVALIIGTFVHGLGNYEAMRNDEDMPFANEIKNLATVDEACCVSDRCFQAAATASRKVFEDALDFAKAKAAEEVQAAVAAAAAAASEREQDALALRQGGAAANAVLHTIPNSQADNSKLIIRDDFHFVTLPRLRKAAIKAVCKESWSSFASELSFDESIECTKSLQNESKEYDATEEKVVPPHHRLPMPDSRVLDRRVIELINKIESKTHLEQKHNNDTEVIASGAKLEESEVSLINSQVCSSAILHVFAPDQSVDNLRNEYNGIGFSGSQCSISHRSLDDGSDFSMGSANQALYNIAYGADSPRYLRAIGVPMNLTRFAISAIVHGDDAALQKVLETERIRNYGENAKIKLKGETVLSAEDKPGNTRTFCKSISDLVPDVYQRNAKLRASICATVLFFGFPCSATGQKTVDKYLWTMLREHSGLFDDVLPDQLFGMEKFKSLVSLFAPDIELPDSESIQDYVENVLIPHCLRLCILGNGPSTRNARGSKGEYETSFGISNYPEPSEKRPSPLPDPLLPLSEQSLEALAYASAILRRVRLMRAVVYIASGEVSIDVLDKVTRSSFMRKNLEGLPLWWCPWIHDVALLVHAATHGLFSLLIDRRNPALLSGNVFAHNAIVQSMYSTFVADEETSLPRFVVDQSSPEEETEWIDIHSKDFPTANVLERRLSFLCALATSSIKDEIRYHSLPMFDHGGWPRN